MTIDQSTRIILRVISLSLLAAVGIWALYGLFFFAMHLYMVDYLVTKNALQGIQKLVEALRYLCTCIIYVDPWNWLPGDLDVLLDWLVTWTAYYAATSLVFVYVAVAVSVILRHAYKITDQAVSRFSFQQCKAWYNQCYVSGVHLVSTLFLVLFSGQYLATLFPLFRPFAVLVNALVLNPLQVNARPWTLLTSLFVHKSTSHLFYSLSGTLGRLDLLETSIGRTRFLIAFVVIGTSINFLRCVLHSHPLFSGPMLFYGANTVISGLLVLKDMFVSNQYGRKSTGLHAIFHNGLRLDLLYMAYGYYRGVFSGSAHFLHTLSCLPALLWVNLPFVPQVVAIPSTTAPNMRNTLASLRSWCIQSYEALKSWYDGYHVSGIYLIEMLCVLSFTAQYLATCFPFLSPLGVFVDALALNPLELRSRPWALFTSLFVHKSVYHLVWCVCMMKNLDNVEKTIGRVRFFTSFLVLGGCANLLRCAVYSMPLFYSGPVLFYGANVASWALLSFAHIPTQHREGDGKSVLDRILEHGIVPDAVSMVAHSMVGAFRASCYFVHTIACITAVLWAGFERYVPFVPKIILPLNAATVRSGRQKMLEKSRDPSNKVRFNRTTSMWYDRLLPDFVLNRTAAARSRA